MGVTPNPLSDIGAYSYTKLEKKLMDELIRTGGADKDRTS